MDAGPSRKRLRRSTRSCYQCRKRKVKCQLTDENVETCAECIKSGTRCTLQPPETESSSGGSPAHVDKHDHDSRLERIESLLQKLVDAQQRNHSAEEKGSSEQEPTQSLSAALWDDFLFHPQSDEALPLVNDRSHATSQQSGTPDPKQSLVSLLPSAQDALTIVTNSTAWRWGSEYPPGSVLTPSDTSQLIEVAAISRGSAVHVAKSLLLFALYMQQLPANFDTQFLESQSTDTAIEFIVEQVRLFILSHQDEASSVDGIECLILLAQIRLNAGAIREAWMTFRRILDVSRLKGLQNSFSLPARNSTSSEIALHRRLWLSAVCADCYCSILLGLEPSIGVAPFGPDAETWNDPLAEADAIVQRRICLIVARIAQRNAIGLFEDRHMLREINEALERLQDSLPPSWWRVPPFRQDRPLDSAKDPNRLICQLWFFQARMFAHIPIAFGKPSNDLLKSLESCMEASRITLQRCVGLQHAKDQLSRCRSVDQSIFVASVVLILAKVQFQSHEVHDDIHKAAFRHDSDRALLEQVIDSFEPVGKACHNENVECQISEIISSMLDIIDSDSENSHLTAGDSDLDVTLALGTRLGSEFVTEGIQSVSESGMRDIIASSIYPALDENGPAACLIKRLFATQRSGLEASKNNPESAYRLEGPTLDTFIDHTVLDEASL